jgi:membrane-bound inhibitor of C-type lysozyme
MPRLSKPTAAAAALTTALLNAICNLPAIAEQAPVPSELRFDCIEQAGLRVVVGANGQMASEATPASGPDPVPVHVINLQHRTSGPAIPARIDSSDDNLTASTATWQPGNSVSADDGRLRLDLINRSLYLVTPELGNQAHFRRFSCTAAAQDLNQTHYQCEPGFQLWISFVTGSDGKSANVRYTGGELDLPQVRSGSGARYQRDDNELWIKGDEALFQLAGSEQHRCSVAD